MNVRVSGGDESTAARAGGARRFPAPICSYRLNVLRIYLPPLRDRRDDIALLVRRFVKDYSKRHDREFLGISAVRDARN